jgi:hypothetical protein
MSKKKKKSSFLLNAKILATLAVVTYLSLAANGWLPIADSSLNVAAAGLATIPGEDVPVRNIRLNTSPAKSTQIPPHVIGVVRPIRSIPDGLNNFRATSITPEELRAALAMGTLKKVMNLSGDVPGKMTMAQIRAICKEYSVEYVTSGTLDRFAAHDGYQEGRGYVRSAAAAARHLVGGNVLVVDRSGNRAGALIGYYLIVHHGFSLEEIIRHNNWEAFSKQPGKSYKYLETVVGAVQALEK